MALTGTITDLH